MSGPRVTSGSESKQDYATPDNFLAAVTQRFAPIQFDLAAHRGNHKHARYFAPAEFSIKYDPDDKKKFDTNTIIDSLVRHGADIKEASAAIISEAIGLGEKATIKVKNRDKEAHGFDAFAHSWAALSRKFKHGEYPGLLWLNCEFSDIAPWAKTCAVEAELGANIVLLTPAAIGSNWYRDNIAGRADIYELGGRLCFDGKNPYPKDCILSHFYPGAKGNKYFWDWNTDRIRHTWHCTK